jgi:hypothetical protein
LSVATLRYYDFNGHLPGYENLRSKNQNIDPDKAAFSTAPHDEEAYAPVGMGDHDDNEPEFNAGPYGGSSHVPHDPHDPDAYNMSSLGGRPSNNSVGNPFTDSDTAYHGGSDYQPPSQLSGGRIYAPPSAQDDYDEDRPAQFPPGDYNRIH